MIEQHYYYGRLTRNAEMKTIEDSTVINFTIAVNNDYKDRKTGQTVKRTLYVDCSYWRKNFSETARKYFTEALVKGALVIAVGREGSISIRHYFEKDGDKYRLDSNKLPIVRTVLTMRVDDLTIPPVGLRSEDGTNGATIAQVSQQDPVTMTSDVTKDDLPF